MGAGKCWVKDVVSGEAEPQPGPTREPQTLNRTMELIHPEASGMGCLTSASASQGSGAHFSFR